MLPHAATIKPTHKAIQTYFQTLKSYATLNQTHETGVRTAFIRLLEDTAKPQSWTLVTEVGQKVQGHRVVPDATLYKNAVPRGYYEAKDTKDDLDSEIRKKVAKGYPLTNIIFEDSRQAVLYQNKQEEYRAEDLKDPQQVAHLLNTFYGYTEPVLDTYDQALEHFSEQVPQLARGLVHIVENAHRTNKRFVSAFDTFFELCKTSLNPNIRQVAVDEMLVQHLLTERLIRKIFDNPEFTQRNVIAVEIEKVIAALVSQSFNRDEFLHSLDSFYQAIESAAHGLEFSQKQTLLNEVYERFFQGYSVKVADTHGIVYTPQPIVDFMCASVVEVLQTEFGKTLGDEDVVILDPATGTGNFIVNLLRRLPKRDLEATYKERLFANEIMLLPYYIAALNIEHAYYELAGHYESFEGLCFVDTLDIAQRRQLSFLTEANSTRVERQKAAPITVIIGNPPYNVGQINENDNNKNRKYEIIDKRIRETYAGDSKASNVNKLSDVYVKFFRWAADRLQGRDGVVCYVSNNSFVDQIAFDGMRKNLLQDFTCIYHVDLHGNVRQNPKLSGTTHNVFGIQVGVGITVAVLSSKHQKRHLFYYRVPENWRKEEKYHWLGENKTIRNVEWRLLAPDTHHTWLTPENTGEFATFLPIADKASKSSNTIDAKTIFKIYSNGIQTNRDTWLYDFDRTSLTEKVNSLIEVYNGEIDRWKRAKKPKEIDSFVTNDETKIKWCSRLKENFVRGIYAEYSNSKVRIAQYRPYCRQLLFFDAVLNHRQSVFPYIFPTPSTEQENCVIALTDIGSEKPFMAIVSVYIADLHLVGAGAGTQCFPFYSYDEVGSNRRENITGWALQQFRKHYGDESITKWDIFYYVYGVLHHSKYRQKFADNLKHELPRVPFAPDFRAFADPGRQLADLHLAYETVTPYKLQWIESNDMPLSYHVEKMRLNKDKTALKVNDSLTLAGIPSEAFEYRLGNRSALEWVIDQYQVTTDKRSGITSDPNRPDEPRYIVDLVGRMIAVSLETVKIVAGLPKQYADSVK